MGMMHGLCVAALAHEANLISKLSAASTSSATSAAAAAAALFASPPPPPTPPPSTSPRSSVHEAVCVGEYVTPVPQCVFVTSCVGTSLG